MNRIFFNGRVFVLVMLLAVGAFAQGPPASPRATSDLDGRVELRWYPPGIIPGEPMFESFEGGMPTDWTIEGTALTPATSGWIVQANTTAPDGGQLARCGYGGFSEPEIVELMITNEVSIGILNPTLSFYHRGTFLSDDDAPNYVKISTDGGINWDVLVTYDPFGGDNTIPADWTLEVIDLSEYIGETVKLAWEYRSQFGEWWYLDAIELSAPELAAQRWSVLDTPADIVVDKLNYVEPNLPIINNNSLSGWASASALRELSGYEILRDGSSLTTVGIEVLNYTDLEVTNGNEYCYVLVAQYPEGNESADAVCATPVNHMPMMPTGLQGVVDNLTVTLDWDDNTDYDLDHYNVYRDGFLVGSSPVSNFVEILIAGGIYEYAVTAVDAEDGESELSDDISLPAGNLPPVRLSAESGLDGIVNLEWAAPGDLLPGLLDCGDELIEGLPFTATGTNLGMENDFNSSLGDGEDYAFQLWMPEDGVIDITLCSPNTDYDTKLEIFNADCFTTTGFYNDDGPFGGCPESPANYAPSELLGVSLPEGIYLIVVDGFFGATGNFEIQVTESATRSAFVAEDPAYEIEKLARLGIEPQPWEMSSAPIRVAQLREQTGYQVYRDGVAVSEPLSIDTLTYTDQYIPNGFEYCYTVEAIYDDGNSASTPVCATPLNHPPVAPLHLTSAIDNHDISLVWEANTFDYDFASYNVYRDDELVMNTTDTVFAENLPLSHVYQYYVTSMDAEDAESPPSNTVILPVGNLPPSDAHAESGLDGAVQLSWAAPGGLGGEGLSEDFETGIFPPADWSMMQTNANESWELSGEFFYEGLYSASVGWDEAGGHQDEWLLTPEFTVGGGDVLTFWSLAQQGSIYGDHYYVKVTTDGGLNWDEVLDMSALPVFDNPDFNNYNVWDVPYSVDLSAYAGASVQIAFHAIDVNNPGDPNYPGLWWFWMLDAIEVGPPAGPTTFSANTGLFGTLPTNAAREASAQPYHTGDVVEFEPVFIQSPVREMRNQVGEYHIYRSLSTPVMIDETDLLVTLDTNTFDYYDFEPLINGTPYYYVIAANYPDDEEISVSAQLMATPMNHAPAAPMDFVGLGDEEINVVLGWSDNTEYDFVSYNVYRDGEFVANVFVSEFSEQLTEPGIFEYMVTAVDAEDAESAPSEAVRIPTGPLPPERLRAESGMDGEVFLDWAAPGDLMPGLLECGNALIESLPFMATGSNAGWGNNFDVSGSDGEDFVYQLWMPADGSVDITLCSDQTNFDTKLEIFNADCFTSTGFYDDDFTCTYSGLYSSIIGAFLPEGIYLIVVDGFSGQTGNYGIEVVESATARQTSSYNRDAEIEKLLAAGQNPLNMNLSSAEIRVPQATAETAERSLDGFQVYRDGVAISAILPLDTYSYLDGWQVEQELTNGTAYCYTVAAVYSSATTQSIQSCATPLNHQPMIPQNVTISVNTETNIVSLDWDDNTDYDLAGYHVYRDEILVGTVTESTFDEVVIDGSFFYVVNSFDTGNMESDDSERLQVLVGQIPPGNLVADGEFDDQISLSWRVPGNPMPPLLDCGDELIPGLPFVSNGSTVGMGDDFDVAGAGTDNEDVAYQLYMPEDGTIDITLCGPNIDYDARLEVFNVDCITSTNYVDDDGPTGAAAPGIIGPSELLGIFLPEGVYLIVVDGYGANSGNYDITVTESTTQRQYVAETTRETLKKLVLNGEMTRDEADALLAVEVDADFTPQFVDMPAEFANLRETEEILHYTVYRDGALVATTTEIEYDDMVEENVFYSYYVTATYDGDAESAPSNTIDARSNMAPGPPTNLVAEDFGHTVTMTWQNPLLNMDLSPCFDLAGLEIRRNGSLVATVDAIESGFMDFSLADGHYVYEISGFDEVPNHGAPISAEVWVGPKPVIVQVFTDIYPTESSWNIYNSINAVVASTAPGDLTVAGQLYEWAVILEPGEYVFEMNDSYGDGIYAPGYYQVNHGADILVGPETLELFQEITPFTVESNIMMGDLDGDGFLNIADVIRFIEIMTETQDPPTFDELSLMDINGDGNHNILDVVLLIENVLNMGGLAKDAPIIEAIALAIPPMTLDNTREWQNIPITTDCFEMISGFQIDLRFDPTLVELGLPILDEGNENVGVFSSINGNIMRVLGIDLSGGLINLASGLLMNVPVQVIDPGNSGSFQFEVENLIISGPGGVEIVAQCLVSIIDIGLPAPTEFSLKQNFPNPFNPTTSIRYDIAETADANLVIYNMLGQQVRTLVSGKQDVGYYEVVWNGLNDAGQPVATGIYIYHLQAGHYAKTMKMAFIK